MASIADRAADLVVEKRRKDFEGASAALESCFPGIGQHLLEIAAEGVHQCVFTVLTGISMGKEATLPCQYFRGIQIQDVQGNWESCFGKDYHPDARSPTADEIRLTLLSGLAKWLLKNAAEGGAGFDPDSVQIGHNEQGKIHSVTVSWNV